jgi:hypothetical protein
VAIIGEERQMARGKRGDKIRSITVTDPLEVNFLRRVQKLNLEEQTELLLLVEAVLSDEPRPIIREAALRFVLVSGVDETEATKIADRFIEELHSVA